MPNQCPQLFYLRLKSWGNGQGEKLSEINPSLKEVRYDKGLKVAALAADKIMMNSNHTEVLSNEGQYVHLILSLFN